jgi:UDP-glucose 4-epimerase
MNILLTGATGFIGSEISKQIIESGNNLLALVRVESDLFRIADLLPSLQTLKYSSLTEKKLIESLKKFRPDILIHCGWKGVDDRDSYQQLEYNLPFVADSVELAYLTGCRQWLGIGSQAEYGIVNKPIVEETSLNPITMYGAAKAAAFYTSKILCKKYKLIFSWARIFSVYGPNDNKKYLIPYIIKNIISGKSPQITKCEQKWDYLYVSDAASAILKIAELKLEGAFNIGSGNAVVLKEVVELIRNKINNKIELSYGSINYTNEQNMHLEADIRKLSEISGWHPKINLDEGLDKVIKSFNIR